MKNTYIVLMVTVFLTVQEGFSQNRLCVCFEKGNPDIEIKYNENSSHTDFSIVKSGYETEELRQKAMAEFWEKKDKHPLLILRPPIFYINYFATKEPVKLNSIKNIDCTGLVSLQEFRLPEFERPPNTRSNSFIFIQKISGNKYLKWEVIQNAIE